MICQRCNCDLMLVEGDGVYNIDYLICSECDPTYTYKLDGFMDATVLYWDRDSLEDARGKLFDMFMSEEHSDAESYIYCRLEEKSNEEIVNMMYKYEFVRVD